MTFSNIGVTPLTRRVLEGGVRAGPVWLLLLIATALPIFWNGFVSIIEAWQLPEYSHGPLIPVLSAYLFLRDMKFVPPANGPVVDRWPGVAVVLVSYLIAAIGNAANIYDIVTYGFIVWIFGVILILFGARRGWIFWPAVLHLIFMLPLPQFVYWQVTTQLQLISSELGVAVIRLMNIPVFLDGNIIDLGIYKLQVAEACSGLRYLFPALSFTYIFSVLYQGPRWHKAVLLLSAAPITVLMNSFRIGVIGVLVENYGIEQAEGFLHLFEGWVIFGAVIAILIGMAATMQRLTSDPKPLSVVLDLDFSGLGHQLRRMSDITAARALVAAALATSALSVTYVLVPPQEFQRVDRAPFGLFPLKIGEFAGRPAPQLDPEIERVLAADDYVNIFYSDPDGVHGVDFFSAFYAKQSEGSGIHSPEVCIPGGGWEMSDIEQVRIDLSEEAGVAPFEVNRAIIQLGERRQLVYYWFEQRGRRMTNDYLVKVSVLWDSITTGRQDGALVRLITPLAPREPEKTADARLQRFMAELLPVIPRFIPGA